MVIARRTGGNIGRLSLGRVAGTIIRRTRIILLTPIGRLELLVSRCDPPGRLKDRLLPLALVIIRAVGISLLVPLTLMIIPAVGIPMLAH